MSRIKELEKEIEDIKARQKALDELEITKMCLKCGEIYRGKRGSVCPKCGHNNIIA